MEDPDEVTPPNSTALITELTIVPGTVINTAANSTFTFFTDNLRKTSPLMIPVIIPTGAKYSE